jgi:heme exporter protein C
MQATDARTPSLRVQLSMMQPLADALRTASGIPVIVLLRRADNDLSFAADALVAVDPLLTLPFITALEERARIIFFHVPMSWIATIAYLLAMIYGIRYLRTRSLTDDDAVVATASVGTLFAVLATTTGSVWAKFNWGSFWNWDPRQTSIVVLLLIYAAFFLLRSAIDEPRRRARLSSVYAIVAFVSVPFLMFVLPRMLTSLHPGGKGDPGGVGPLLSPQSDAINPTKQVLFALSLFAFTLVYSWLVNIRMRVLAVQRQLDHESSQGVS